MEEPRFAEAVVITFLAGTAAEARVAGFRNPLGEGFDLDLLAREWLRRLESPDLDALTARATALVEENWPAVERLAHRLQSEPRLPAQDALAAAG